MVVAQTLDVGEHLVAAGARRRAGGRERVAHQHDPGLAMTGADHEIDRPDLHVGDLDRAGELAQARHQGIERRLRRLPHLAQPRILHVAVDEQIGAHDRADRKQREIGHAIFDTFGKIGERAEIEAAAADRGEIEADADGMASAQHLASDAELMAQRDIEPVRQHDQAGG